jgi:hypothetical protein
MRTLLFRLIGVLEIAGGLYGVAAMLHRLLPFGMGRESVYALLGLAVFGFVLAAGGPQVSRLGVNVLALASWLVLRLR